jgi:hypothetical protein
MTSFTDKGVTAATFAEEVSMSFSFVLAVPAGDLSAGYHKYSIGVAPDTTKPIVSLGALALLPNGTYTSSITLSEKAGNSTVFDGDDLRLTNATASLSGSGVTGAKPRAS